MIVTDLTHAGTTLCSSEEFKRGLIICYHLNPLSHTPDVTRVTNDTGVSFASLIAQGMVGDVKVLFVVYPYKWPPCTLLNAHAKNVLRHPLDT